MSLIDKVLGKSFKDFITVLKNPKIIGIAFLLVLISIVTEMLPVSMGVKVAIEIAMRVVALYFALVQMKLIAETIDTDKYQENELEVTSSKYISMLVSTILSVVILLGGIFLIAAPIYTIAYVIGRAAVLIATPFVMVVVVIAALVLMIKISQYPYLILIDDSNSPIKDSIKITDGYTLKIILLSLILTLIMVPIIIIFAIPMVFLGMSDNNTNVIMVPMIMFVSIFLGVVNYNVYMRLKELNGYNKIDKIEKPNIILEKEVVEIEEESSKDNDDLPKA